MSNEINKLEIEKTLVISTSHISENDYREVNKQAEGDNTKAMKYPYLMVENHSFGFVIILGDANDIPETIRLVREDFSDAFANILSLASSLEVDNVRFDHDGQEYDFLPTFEH
jgi:hypothetical protein